MMNHVKAIGFDLFNTLIVMDQEALIEAFDRLAGSLGRSGFDLDLDAFKVAYRESALRFLEAARQDGRETHNRFWISAALQGQGHAVEPGDRRIEQGVDAYFSVFLDACHLLPGTLEMLGAVKGRHRLGLLSNFTHSPAALAIIERLGLRPFFDVVLISGDLGYRKPHPFVFERLIEEMGVGPEEMLYVGDDPEPDVTGARGLGIQPVWTTQVQDKHIPYSKGEPGFKEDEPDPSVPRISNWQDFLDLLS
jgi:putative hydrolase of the HAD superfamily